jgi:hypothetical protein
MKEHSTENTSIRVTEKVDRVSSITVRCAASGNSRIRISTDIKFTVNYFHIDFLSYSKKIIRIMLSVDRLCGLVVRVPVYSSRGPGSIPGTTRFSEK